MKALKRQGKLYDFHKSQQSSNLAVMVFSAVYFWTSTIVTLFINVNPRFTFPLQQTKIIPYLLHFTKRDSKGILFYWMFAKSLIGFEKEFFLSAYGKLSILINVLSNWRLCWRHVLEWLIGKLLDKDFTSFRKRMRNLKAIKQIFYAGPLNLLCSNKKILGNRHYGSIFLGDNWNYAFIITVLTRLLMFAVRKVLVQSRITIVTSSSQSPVKSSTLQLWSCVIVNFVLAFQVTQWDLGQTQYFDLCATVRPSTVIHMRGRE